jgi:hypothetical protein
LLDQIENVEKILFNTKLQFDKEVENTTLKSTLFLFCFCGMLAKFNDWEIAPVMSDEKEISDEDLGI